MAFSTGKEEAHVNRLQTFFIRRLQKRGRSSSRNPQVKPLRRTQTDGWKELSYQNAISYWTKAQGAR